MSIELQRVRVDLPVYNTKVRSLRKVLMKATVGGPLMHGNVGAVFIRALNNVSVKIEDGERVGLVGGNGAGKTTLLKILAGVLAPSEGTVQVSGTVSAALNIALGIDSEISGRENIFLLGYYRGLKRSQIEAEVASIAACADLGNYINLPVSTYSSGMRGRLTFAVATAFSADVLLLDEWLLTGDASFMEGALRRTLDLLKSARIVVLATHNLDVVREHCSKAIFMKAGDIVAIGSPSEITAQYEADTHADYLASLAQRQQTTISSN